jgi:hypothetical protein
MGLLADASSRLRQKWNSNPTSSAEKWNDLLSMGNKYKDTSIVAFVSHAKQESDLE